MSTRIRNVFIRMGVSVVIFAYVGYLAYYSLPRGDFWIIISFFAVFLTWSVIETVIYKDPETFVVKDNDQRSYMYLQLSSLLVLFYALFDFTSYQWSRLHEAEPAVIGAGFVLFFINAAVRYTAITQLGALYNPRVALYGEHHLVDTGIYRYIRHPMYLSAILNTISISLIFSSWGGLVIIALAVLPAVWYRIRIEEEFLLHHFGDAYFSYVQRSKRLLPGIW